MSSTYLVVLPLKMQRRLTEQSIPHFFTLSEKETTHKPLKVAAAKTLFSSMYVTGTTCFDECFFDECFHVIIGRHYFS